MLGPDRRGEGTNALLLRLSGRGTRVQFAFGDGVWSSISMKPGDSGSNAALHDAPGIAFDLDTPADWADFLDRRLRTSGTLTDGTVGVRRVRRVNGGDEVRIIGIDGIPEVRPAMIWPRSIADGIAASGAGSKPVDIVVVTHKIVSKAEGQVVDLRTIDAFAAGGSVWRALG